MDRSDADLSARLDALAGIVEGARTMPMSASCILNRGELLAAIDDIRDSLPEEMTRASRIVSDRDGVIDEGRVEADRIVAEARDARRQLLASSDVVVEAREEADRIRDEATEDAERMRSEVDDYIDARLASFEVVLNKTLAAVGRGREKLGGRSAELAELSGEDDLFAPADLPR